MRLLLSEFDIEGRYLGKDFTVKMVGVTINLCTATLLTVFLNMLVKRNLISFLISLSVTAIQTIARKRISDTENTEFEELR